MSHKDNESRWNPVKVNSRIKLPTLTGFKHSDGLKIIEEPIHGSVYKKNMKDVSAQMKSSCISNKPQNSMWHMHRQFHTCLTVWQISGQSYKHFTLVNYDSRVVIWGIFQSGTTLES